MKDSLPWVELFRPNKLEDILSHDKTKNILKNYIKTGKLPHFLFYGPSGSGKTSMIKAFAREFYGKHYDLMVIEINASEARGIDVVRKKIQGFVLSTPCFFEDVSHLPKLVILDEADSMTSEAQAMLRHVIEKNTKSARFCLICNYKTKIIDAIQSRCTPMRFSPLDKINMKIKLDEISKLENINITDDGKDMLIKVSKGDMRGLLNLFQSVTMQDKLIDKHFLSECLGYPNDKQIDILCDYLKGDILSDNIKNVKDYITSHGLSLRNILDEISIKLFKRMNGCDNNQLNQINNVLSQLSDIEINMCNSPNIDIQISTMVSIYFIEFNNK